MERFSSILQECAIILASNMVREGETEYQVQFDQEVIEMPATPRTPAPTISSTEQEEMSFEEFQLRMAHNPHLSTPGLNLPLPIRTGRESNRISRWQSMTSLPSSGEPESEDNTLDEEVSMPHSTSSISLAQTDEPSEGRAARFKASLPLRKKKTRASVYAKTPRSHSNVSALSGGSERTPPRKKRLGKKSSEPAISPPLGKANDSSVDD